MFFELYRRHPIIIAVSTAWVVEQLNVVEYLSLGLTPCFVDLAFNALRFQQ